MAYHKRAQPTGPVTTFEGMVQKVIHRSDKSSFKILKVAGKTVKGYIDEIIVGRMYHFEGHVQEESNGYTGKFLMATKCEAVIDVSQQGIVNYLCQEAPGIAWGLATELYRAFGKETMNVISSDPIRVATKIHGIKLEQATKLQVWATNEARSRDVKQKLHEIGLSANQISKIVRKYGKNSLIEIKNNCFKLTEIDGFGFVTVSKIAETCGVPKDDRHRVMAGIIYAFNEFFDEGHVCVGRTSLIQASTTLLEVHKNLVAEVLEEMLATHVLAKTGDDWKKHDTDADLFGGVDDFEDDDNSFPRFNSKGEQL